MNRRKPLISKTPLARKTPIKARSALRSKATIKPRRHREDIPPSSRAEVESRSMGRCEAGFDGCAGQAAQMHHRKLRRSRDHSPINLLHLCVHCHNGVIHRNSGWSYRHGFLVKQHEDPAQVPIKFGCQPLCACLIDGLPVKLEASHRTRI